MKAKNDALGARKFKVSHVLLAIAALYLIFISLKLPQFLKIAAMINGDDTFVGMDETNKEEFGYEGRMGSASRETFYRKLGNNQNPNSRSLSKDKEARLVPVRPLSFHYGRITGEVMQRKNRTNGLSDLERMAEEAWNLGLKAWEEIKGITAIEGNESSIYEGQYEKCPSGLSLTGDELKQPEYVMVLPCGLAAGSAITIIGTPHHAHEEFVPQLARYRYSDGVVLVSQFVVELQGLKSVVGEEPPKILHLNPRLKGDWGKRPVIEHNTCYRMQWGVAQRCNGLPSKDDDDIVVDGYRRCERWTENDAIDSKESKTASWFKRFIGREQKPDVSWPFPFVEGRMFIMTIRAGIDGFHISVGGRHVSSFSYRMGFTLEDATGLVVKGNIDIHSIYSTSLPTSHPSFSPQRVLEMSPKWKSFPFPKSIVQLFVGILSATNHFAERMAVRKTWMQCSAIKSSYVAVRFFVALNSRREVNALLKKEAAYFGDIVILPFIDRYELVVLKTIAICEYGVHNTTAVYIMKCDDDAFVRVDSVLKEIGGVLRGKSLYMGNLNLLHRPLRTGKWAVSYEEWSADIYPPYANGPAYIISNDIAKFIVSRHANHSLGLFKMEDVSMGMWVEQFNASSPVQYSHNWKFCQYGCMEDYYTAHYQSPRQMMCLWDNLARGHAHCCNSR